MMRLLMSMAILAALLAVTACSSPDSMDSDETPTPPGQAEASPTEAVPSPSATSQPQPSSTPTTLPAGSPTATATTEPSPTEMPVEPSPTASATAAPDPTPTPSPAAGAADVWDIWQFETDESVIVLTFDAGADRGYTEDILDILAAEGILASFGMTGRWAEDNPDLLARIVDEGHHLINHTWSHPHMPQLTSEERIEELQSLEALVMELTGVDMRPYFRPPFGEYDEATLADLAASGYTVNVLWTVDTLGWNGLTAEEINARVLDAAAPGAIVLMHVGIQSQDAAALPEMIRLLREQGYGFATVAELAGV